MIIATVYFQISSGCCCSKWEYTESKAQEISSVCQKCKQYSKLILFLFINLLTKFLAAIVEQTYNPKCWKIKKPLSGQSLTRNLLASSNNELAYYYHKILRACQRHPSWPSRVVFLKAFLLFTIPCPFSWVRRTGSCAKWRIKLTGQLSDQTGNDWLEVSDTKYRYPESKSGVLATTHSSWKTVIFYLLALMP